MVGAYTLPDENFAFVVGDCRPPTVQDVGSYSSTWRPVQDGLEPQYGVYRSRYRATLRWHFGTEEDTLSIALGLEELYVPRFC